MSSNKTKVVPLRIPIEVAEYIDSKTTDSRGRTVEKIIKSYQKVETLCLWGDMDADELCEQLEQMFLDGKLIIADGNLHTLG